MSLISDFFRDLVEKCPTCNGSGAMQLYGPEGTPPELGTRRPMTQNCVLLYDLPHGCQPCDGTGKIWTASGKVLAEILTLKVNAKAAIPTVEQIPESRPRPAEWIQAAFDGLTANRPGHDRPAVKDGFSSVLPAGTDSSMIGTSAGWENVRR